jgi:disulfide bond formation protein DsbB
MIDGTPSKGQNYAAILALAIPALALGGAYISQYGFGFYPCEMCWWQRYPHFAALPLALLGFIVQPKKLWIALAALAIITSGLIGGYHAGVEYGWWEGLSTCTASVGGSLEDIMNAPIIRCDQAPFYILGISLAGGNFLFSAFGGIAILGLLLRKA